VQPTVRILTLADLRDCLSRGWADFLAYPTYAVFLAVLYPLAGLALAIILNGFALLPYLLPLAAGFAILGPVAALPLYDISRQRERGEAPTLVRSMARLRGRTLLPVLGLGLLLALIFTVWLLTARSIYVANFDYAPVLSMTDFLHSLRVSKAGHRLLLQGLMTGGVFAALAFALSVVSFPLLIDREAGFVDAILASLRVVLVNPLVMLVWGGVIAAVLVLASLPLFIGLSIALPLLAHASWHLYREAVA
jgi:uncharacterized membrane protein